MDKQKRKKLSWLKRHRRIRKKIFGTEERPRLSVYRSLKNIYTQLIDDVNSRTLISVSTRDVKLRDKLKYGGNIKAATLLGQILAKEAKGKGITKVVFDRGGYCYHGRIKALAEAVRKSGLSF